MNQNNKPAGEIVSSSEHRDKWSAKVGTADQPYLIAVAGGSGAGKTTFAKALHGSIGVNDSAIISMDSYYIDQSANYTGEGSVNFDHPDAFEFSLLSEHLSQIKLGKSVELPIYSFLTHKRSDQITEFVPKPIVIIEGILILHDERVRSLIDYSAFIQTPTKTRHRRRLERDVKERGASAGGVRTDVVSFVEPMHLKYVEPSLTNANWSGSGESPVEELLKAFIEKFSQDFNYSS